MNNFNNNYKIKNKNIVNNLIPYFQKYITKDI